MQELKLRAWINLDNNEVLVCSKSESTKRFEHNFTDLLSDSNFIKYNNKFYELYSTSGISYTGAPKIASEYVSKMNSKTVYDTVDDKVYMRFFLELAENNIPVAVADVYFIQRTFYLSLYIPNEYKVKNGFEDILATKAQLEIQNKFEQPVNLIFRESSYYPNPFNKVLIQSNNSIKIPQPSFGKNIYNVWQFV